MRNKYKVLSVLLVMMLVSGTAFGWGSTGGDGSSIRAVQETAVFFNNSGRTLWTGCVVVLDLSGSDMTTGTTLGSYVTTTAEADNHLVMGVVKIASNDNTPVVVITQGPADCSFDVGSDWAFATNEVGDPVGSTTKAGYAGAGSKLGFIMENPATTVTYNELWIWVDPHNSE